MPAGTDSHPDDPHVAAPGRVRQVTLPPAARALSTLAHVDYEDAFLVETGPAQDRTGEQRARAILEDAPVSTRNALCRGGLRSACGSVQLSLTDLCPAGRSGAAPPTSRSLAPAAASGCRANRSSNASSTRCCSPPSYNWRTASHAHCGVQNSGN